MNSIRGEITGRRGDDFVEAEHSNVSARGPPTCAFTIQQFCTAHNISPAFYFELQKRGEGPRVMAVGRRRLISIEEAARWREARTNAVA
jgi:hypothetical protein